MLLYLYSTSRLLVGDILGQWHLTYFGLLSSTG